MSILSQRGRNKIWTHEILSSLTLQFPPYVWRAKITGSGAILMPCSVSVPRCIVGVRRGLRQAPQVPWPEQRYADSREASGTTTGTDSQACEGPAQLEVTLQSLKRCSCSQKGKTEREQCQQSCPLPVSLSGGGVAHPASAQITSTISPQPSTLHHWRRMQKGLYILAANTTHAGKVAREGLLDPSFHPKHFILFLFMAAFKETITAEGRYILLSLHTTQVAPPLRR